MKRKCILPVAVLILCCSYALPAQVISGADKWDLRRCVEYALSNNLDVQQSMVQSAISDVNLQQSRWQQYPTADFDHTSGLSWGRPLDPSTNQYTSAQVLSQTFSVNVGITVFNWHRIRNNIIASHYEANAFRTDVEKIKNDVALNVATYYLQVLLARQQVEIAKVQMQQTLTQLDLTRKKVAAGAVPELDALTLEGQYATDSSAYISALANADQNLLQLKQVLNVDAGKPFDITSPPIEQIPVEPILQLQPETVFEIAMQNQPAQKANQLRIQSLEASMSSSRASMYPTISIGGSLGTNFSSPSLVTTEVNRGYAPSKAYITDNLGNRYDVYTPDIALEQHKVSFGDRWTGWGTQINNNFRQNLVLNIAVPINSGGQARFNYQRAKLNLKNAQVVKAQADQTLKNDIYKAYYSASAALEKFNAAKLAADITQKTLDFATKRRDLGLLSTFDWLISQNNLNRAKLDLAAAQFDYVFKIKVLEFYKGQGLRL